MASLWLHVLPISPHNLHCVFSGCQWWVLLNRFKHSCTQLQRTSPSGTFCSREKITFTLWGCFGWAWWLNPRKTDRRTIYKCVSFTGYRSLMRRWRPKDMAKPTRFYMGLNTERRREKWLNYARKLKEDKKYINKVCWYRFLLALTLYWSTVLSPWYGKGILHVGILISRFRKKGKIRMSFSNLLFFQAPLAQNDPNANVACWGMVCSANSSVLSIFISSYFKSHKKKKKEIEKRKNNSSFIKVVLDLLWSLGIPRISLYWLWHCLVTAAFSKLSEKWKMIFLPVLIGPDVDEVIWKLANAWPAQGTPAFRALSGLC